MTCGLNLAGRLFLLGLNWGNVRIMEKKMETIGILRIIGLGFGLGHELPV